MPRATWSTEGAMRKFFRFWFWSRSEAQKGEEVVVLLRCWFLGLFSTSHAFVCRACSAWSSYLEFLGLAAPLGAAQPRLLSFTHSGQALRAICSSIFRAISRVSRAWFFSPPFRESDGVMQMSKLQSAYGHFRAQVTLFLHYRSSEKWTPAPLFNALRDRALDGAP